MANKGNEKIKKRNINILIDKSNKKKEFNETKKESQFIGKKRTNENHKIEQKENKKTKKEKKWDLNVLSAEPRPST